MDVGIEQRVLQQCITSFCSAMSDYSNALLSGSNREMWGRICTDIILNDATQNPCRSLCNIKTCKWIFLFTIDCFIRQLGEYLSFILDGETRIMKKKGQLISWRMSDLSILAQLGLCWQYQVSASIFSSPRLFLHLVWKCMRVQGKTKGMSPDSSFFVWVNFITHVTQWNLKQAWRLLQISKDS